MVVKLLIGLGVSLAVTWLLVLIAILVANRRSSETPDLPRLLKQTIRLLASLARDATLPRGLRFRIAAAILYAGQPFNLIPDWIPVIGYADNLAVIGWALRSVIRKAGPEAVAGHWRGTPESLSQLYKALRINPQGTPAVRRPT